MWTPRLPIFIGNKCFWVRVLESAIRIKQHIENSEIFFFIFFNFFIDVAITLGSLLLRGGG